MNTHKHDILLVEDNPADVRLAKAAFERDATGIVLHMVKDGVDAMAFLHRIGRHADAITPGLIFLDLNLPRKDGREVLAEIKADPILRRIPVIILTTSQAPRDITTSYDLHANGYIVKPTDVDQYFQMIHSTQQFWLKTVTRPPV